MNGTERPAISVAGLRKSYGDQVVLDGIDLRVPAGSVFALLGPNGAGKTTVVNILSTLVPADAGEVFVGGHDVARRPDRVRAGIGVTGQFSALDYLLTGEENLRLMADLWHLGKRGGDRVAELLERFDLVEAARRPVSGYSGGMARRLDIAMGLVGSPGILFLDEPTTGLDPRSRRSMWDIVRELVRDGVTVLLTTQYLEEADQLADRVALLDGGRLVAEGTPEELKRQVPGAHVRLRFGNARDFETAARIFPTAGRDEQAWTLRVPGDGGVASLRLLLNALEAERVEVADFSVHTPDLDDVFLSLTGRRQEALR